MSKYCKFQKEAEYVSYDCGVIWQPTGVSRKIEGRDPVESYSRDCGFYPIYTYKWTILDDDYECEGIKKYAIERLQYSVDGEEWYDVPSMEERVSSTILDYLSEDCGYVESTGGFKFSNGTDTIECGNNSSSVLTKAEVSRYIRTTGNIIGDCTEEIGDDAFSGSTISSFEISDYTKKIGTRAFASCSGLTNITLKTPVIGNDSFTYCTNLSSVTFSSGVTSIGSNAFYYCSGLTNVSLSDTVTKINDYAFKYCKSLPSVRIPSGVTQIGRAAFERCFDLTSITIDNGVKSIGDEAFWMDGVINEISIPSSVIHIGAYAFANCDFSNTNFSLPPNIKTIEEGSLVANIPSITIPNGVNYIGGTALNSQGIKHISFPNSIRFIGGSGSLVCGDECLRVPDGVEVIRSGAFESYYAGSIPSQVTTKYPESLTTALSTIPSTKCLDLGSNVVFYNGETNYYSETGKSIIIRSLIPPVNSSGKKPDLDFDIIYVPQASLSLYKKMWSENADKIMPINF